MNWNQTMNDYKQQSMHIKFRDMKSYSRFINTKHDPSKLEFIARPVHIKGEGDQFSFFLQNQCMMTTRGLNVAQSYDSPKEVLSSLIFLKRLIGNKQNLFICYDAAYCWIYWHRIRLSYTYIIKRRSLIPLSILPFINFHFILIKKKDKNTESLAVKFNGQVQKKFLMFQVFEY